jgi:hypothetical protein
VETSGRGAARMLHPGRVPVLCHPCRGGLGIQGRRTGGVASLDHRLPSGKPLACENGPCRPQLSQASLNGGGDDADEQLGQLGASVVRESC